MADTQILDGEIIITLPVEKVYPGIKRQLEEYLNHFPIKVIPVKKLSQAQNGLIHVLLKQFGDEIGYTLIEIKELMKEQFAIATDKLDFSTAKCDMETANDFIAFLIEQALENDINLYILNKQDKRYRHILEIDKMTERYVIACLKNKTCAICGRNAGVELDHWKTVASSVGNYENDDGLHNPFISLCSQHHTEKHDIGVESFKNKYYIEGVWLNPQLVYDLLKIYPGHFKLFRKRLKQGCYRDIIKNK